MSEYRFPHSYMVASEGLPARSSPNCIAYAAMRAAVERREVQTCSGRADDLTRDIDRKICALVGHSPAGCGEPSIAFTIHRSHDGTLRAYVETERGAWDSIVTREFAKRANRMGVYHGQALARAAEIFADAQIHAPRFDGRIIRCIAGHGRDGERRLDFHTMPCVWTDATGTEMEPA